MDGLFRMYREEDEAPQPRQNLDKVERAAPLWSDARIFDEVTRGVYYDGNMAAMTREDAVMVMRRMRDQYEAYLAGRRGG